jgi:hypothetical protein
MKNIFDVSKVNFASIIRAKVISVLMYIKHAFGFSRKRGKGALSELIGTLDREEFEATNLQKKLPSLGGL